MSRVGAVGYISLPVVIVIVVALYALTPDYSGVINVNEFQFKLTPVDYLSTLESVVDLDIN
jgi:hypothetical protein